MKRGHSQQDCTSKKRTYLYNKKKKKVTGILLNWGSQRGKNNPIQTMRISIQIKKKIFWFTRLELFWVYLEQHCYVYWSPSLTYTICRLCGIGARRDLSTNVELCLPLASIEHWCHLEEESLSLSLSLSVSLSVSPPPPPLFLSRSVQRKNAVLTGYTRGSGGKQKGTHILFRCVRLRGVNSLVGQQCSLSEEMYSMCVHFGDNEGHTLTHTHTQCLLLVVFCLELHVVLWAVVRF